MLGRAPTASTIGHGPFDTGPAEIGALRIHTMSQGLRRGGRTGATLLAVLALVCAACTGGGDDGFVGSAGTAPTTAAPTTTPGVTVGSATNTTVRPVPTTTLPPATTVAPPPTTRQSRATTTTAPAPPVACSSLLLTVEAVAEKPTYRRGEIVRVQATLRNKSDVPCRYTSYGISTRIDDEAGQPVRPAPVLTIDTLEENVLLPGQTLGSTPTWDQQICSGASAPCTLAPPGKYKARATWVFSGAPVEGTATFDLLG